ncbi:MAG: PTS sugar transporter subunit IIA [Verrucomicrobia bacterium]|nr:PTS sugar transporter subunit IIA [Verrucomicrobiota bacterium]
MVSVSVRKETEEIALIDLIKKEHLCFLDVKSKEEAIKALVDTLYLQGAVPDPEGFFKAVLERERVISTGIGMGLAIPHAKTEEVEEFFLAIAVLPQGVDWQAIDSLKVKLVFLIGGPKNKPRDYLRLLSDLTKFVKDEKRRSLLSSAKDKEEFLSLFQG